MPEIGEGPNGPVARGSMTLPACYSERPVRASLVALSFLRLPGSGIAGLVKRVAPGTDTTCNVIAQGRMPPAFLILPDTNMTVEAFEFRFPFCEGVTIGAMLPTVQASVLF